MDVQPSYDFIIVGGGISGLHCALELSKKYKGCTIALAEKYGKLGGRTFSYQAPTPFQDVHWEMGAGRVHISHKRVMELLKQYNLHWIPIGSDTTYFSYGGDKSLLEDSGQKNVFEESILPTFFQPLEQLDPVLLQRHTLYEICGKTFGYDKTKSFFSTFPYASEMYTLRADEALRGFLHHGELSSQKHYGVVAEGFSALVKHMEDDATKQKITILRHHTLMNITKKHGGYVCNFSYGKPSAIVGNIQLHAHKAVICTLHADALRKIPCFRPMKALRHVKTEPLLRTYMIFPTPCWFANLGKVVTNHRLRYIIPIDVTKGSIMISYTDGKDTDIYKNVYYKQGEDALGSMIYDDICRLFPFFKIPKPLFFKAHMWDVGATYWTPGHYDLQTMSDEACNPLPSMDHVYVCGESFSMKQAWVEGALEHSNTCLQKIFESVE
jgi:hypothetical protein